MKCLNPGCVNEALNRSNYCEEHKPTMSESVVSSSDFDIMFVVLFVYCIILSAALVTTNFNSLIRKQYQSSGMIIGKITNPKTEISSTTYYVSLTDNKECFKVEVDKFAFDNFEIGDKIVYNYYKRSFIGGRIIIKESLYPVKIEENH